MESTRIDTAKLDAAVEKANKKLDEVFEILAPFISALTEDERASLLRPRDGFAAGARQLVRDAKGHADLVKAVDFNGEAVLEDLANVDVLDRLAGRSERLQRLIADGRLRWLHEAYQPSLLLYNMAKIGARVDGSLRALADSLAHLFPAGRRKGPEDGKK